NRPERRRSSPDAGARGVDRSPPDAAPRVVEPPKPAATGKLTVVTDTWCDLRIDGILKGRHNPNAPRSYELDAGPHTLHCSQGPGMLSSRSQAKVVANRSRKLTLRLVQAVKVRVRLSKGAAVQIGSRRVGSGGTVSLKPGRYRVTVLNGAGQPIGSKYVTVAAGKPCQLRDVPTVGCFR
ncbi:MAG: hypothetical protein KJO07_18725, partial [Deltaproteobacteria bacterium]|nr:hypothetical protein [Deltaproteobacteria bacterium]